ncbi:MAG: S8 family serine peptidase [Desulfobacteraceae bacterium]
MSCHASVLGKVRVGLIVLVLLAAGGLDAVIHAEPMDSEEKKPDIAAPMEFIPGQVMVQVKPGTPEEEVHKLAAQLQAQVGPQIPEYCLYLFQLPVVEGEAAQQAQLQEAINWLQEQPSVQAAHPNYKVSIPRPVTPPQPRK